MSNKSKTVKEEKKTGSVVVEYFKPSSDADEVASITLVGADPGWCLDDDAPSYIIGVDDEYIIIPQDKLVSIHVTFDKPNV